MSNLLAPVAAAIREHGWAKGVSVADNGSMCVIGAIDHVVNSEYGLNLTTRLRAQTKLIVQLRARLDHNEIRLIAEWNDEARNVNEVLKVLDQEDV